MNPRRASGASSVARRVIRWQLRHGRHGLPWQGSGDPYRVWLSEIMLQQTQVSTVLRYYDRFLNRFPDVRVLAAASLDDVLAAWSGLGYYRRARLLHACAGRVVAEHGGVFPASAQALAALPGIGRSTAAAIAAFCFGERAAILDGNVKRVLTRVLGFGGDLAMAANERELWSLAESLLPSRDVATYTQGLMDLGASLCTLRAPGCSLCPLRAGCVARAEGRQQTYPVKTSRLRRTQRRSAWLWLRDADRHWLTRRAPTGVWAGLWSLPEAQAVDDLEFMARQWPGEGRLLPPIRHALTHFDWTLTPLQWRLPAALGASERHRVESELGDGRWFAGAELAAIGLPAPVRVLLAGAG